MTDLPRLLDRDLLVYRPSTMDDEFFNRRLSLIRRTLDAYATEIEKSAAASDTLIEVGLARIDEVLGPSLEAVHAAGELGFLIGTSETAVQLTVGLEPTISLSDTVANTLFTPTTLMTIQSADDPEMWAVIRLGIWNKTLGPAGAFTCEVISVAGGIELASHDDWVIVAGTGQIHALADQVATDAAQVADDRAYVESVADDIQSGPVQSVSGHTGIVALVQADIAGLVSDLSDITSDISTLQSDKAPIASPTFTGTPAAPTAAGGTNTTQIATTAFVKAAIDGLVASAPGALDTLDELAAALGDDANFASTVTTALSAKEVAANKGQNNGYAGLDSGGKVPTAQLPSTVEYTSNKGAANGYASLGSDTKVTPSQLHWTTVTKTSDESRTSTTTLADDATLKFTMSANTKYRFRIVIYSTLGPGFMKWRHVGPASPTLVRIRRWTNTTTTIVDAAYSSEDISESLTVQVVDGCIHNGSNAGDFKIQWAQTSSNATPSTILAGSYLEYASV